MTPAPAESAGPGGRKPRLAAIVLAGGGSSRMGRPKQLVDWGGRPLLERVVAATLAWPVDRVVTVLGADAEDVLDQVDFGDSMVVLNLEWEEGIASSLRVGLDTLSRDPLVEAAIVTLGDVPSVPLDVVEALVARFHHDDCPAVVPRYRYTWSNPVVVARKLWPRVMSLEGDAGAQGLLKAHPEWVCEVHFDRLPPRDVDTEADLDELRPRL